MTDALIFDVDGTLANCGHRVHHVKNGSKDWDKFFAEMDKDTPVEGVVWLADKLSTYYDYVSKDYAILIVSARPNTYRQETLEWIRKNCPALFRAHSVLYMRADGDHRADTLVKRDLLHKIQGQGFNVRLVIDDRPSVIKMWESEGIPVLQVPNHEWDAPKYTPGELVLMVGPSGAGKTRYVDTMWEPDEVVSSDNLRVRLCGDFKDQSKNAQVFDAAHALIKVRIESGLHTIVDATNLRNRDRRAIRDLVPDNTKITYVVIDRPLRDKERDGGWRNNIKFPTTNAKGDACEITLIAKHDMTFKSNLKDILAGDGDPRVTVLDRRVLS